jgi:hypothetical protein
LDIFTEYNQRSSNRYLAFAENPDRLRDQVQEDVITSPATGWAIFPVGYSVVSL